MSKSLLVKFFLILFFAFSFFLLPADKAYARMEISLDESNGFDKPFPPYRIPQPNPPVTFEGVVTNPGVPVHVTGTVDGCATGKTVNVTAFPVANPKKIITNLNQTFNQNLAVANTIASIIFPGANLVRTFLGIGRASVAVDLPEPGGYYIYAKCGNSEKYEDLDIKYIEVYDPAAPLPGTVAAGPSITGGKYCPNEDAIDTAIGCIPYKPVPFVGGLLKLAMGIGGGIALLIMAAASIQMITSQGNPEALKKAHGQFSSAIVGLLFIIFAVLLLQIIGVNLLNIPGFAP